MFTSVEALVSDHVGNSKKVFVTRAGHLRVSDRSPTRTVNVNHSTLVSGEHPYSSLISSCELSIRSFIPTDIIRQWYTMVKVMN